MIPDELLLNDFAVRCFRDVADADYIAARMTFRAGLVTQYLWASQQAIEKYLKGILLLNRIPAPNVKHQLDLALSKINNSGKLRLDLTQGTKTFLKYVNTYGPFRYLENSPFVFGRDVVRLDRAIWEIRRYCTLSKDGRQVRLRDGKMAPLVRLETGFLEQVIDDPKHAICNEAGQVVFRQPVLQRRRKQKLLIEVANPKALVHASIVRIYLSTSSTL